VKDQDGIGDGDGEELVILIAGGMTSQLTYDGIDVCASRVAFEVSSCSYGIVQEQVADGVGG